MFGGGKSTSSGSSLLTSAGGVLSGLGTIANAGIGIANYYQQAKLMDYERQVQMVSWAREDDAVQRRVRDLQAAGLSPVLAAGSAASSGPVVQTHAPQMSPVPDMSEVAKTVMSLITADKNNSQTEQQTELIKKQQEKTQSDVEINQYNKLRIASEIALNAEKQKAEQYLNRIRFVDAKNAELTGIGGNSSSYGKMFRDFVGAENQLYGAAQNFKRKREALKKSKGGASGGW